MARRKDTGPAARRTKNDSHVVGLGGLSCSHRLCALIGGACSLATHRSRGCRRNVTSPDLAPGVLAEVRALVAALATSDAPRAAVRLAAIVRREALDDRNLVTLVGDEDPVLATQLAALCRTNR